MIIPKTSGIYLLKNKINGKCYIGETINLLQRHNKHKLVGNNAHEYIDKAIIKYGWHNFNYQILKEINTKNKTILWIWENYFIKQYNSLSPLGDNIKPWGKGFLGFKHMQQTKNKISKSHLGKKKQPHSLKTKELRSKLSSKKVRQIDIDTGKIVAIWPSLKEAHQFLTKNNKLSSFITCVINGKLLSAYGYKWELANKNEEIFIDNTINILPKKINKSCDWRKRPIYQINQQTNKVITTWSSITEIKKTLGYSISSIYLCCRGHRKSMHSFIWKYADEV